MTTPQTPQQIAIKKPSFFEVGINDDHCQVCGAVLYVGCQKCASACIARLESDLAEMREENEQWNGLMLHLMSLPAFHNSKREGNNANRVRLFIEDLRGKADGLAAKWDEESKTLLSQSRYAGGKHEQGMMEGIARALANCRDELRAAYRAAQGVDATPPSDSSR